MYLFNSLDRSNLGSAETVNMTGDLGIPADSINQATTLFYATCMLELSLVDCSDLFSRSVYPSVGIHREENRFVFSVPFLPIPGCFERRET
jgi:hypothetical protein